MTYRLGMWGLLKYVSQKVLLQGNTCVQMPNSEYFCDQQIYIKKKYVNGKLPVP